MFKLAHNGKVLMDITEASPESEGFILNALKQSAFSQCEIDHDSIKAFFKGDKTEKILAVAIKRDATFEVSVCEDKMQAVGSITVAQGGTAISFESAKKMLIDAGVTRGYKKVYLETLLKKQHLAQPGEKISEPLAIGMLPINGDPATLKLHVCTLKQRLKQPKLLEDGSVDMRDFGKLSSVAAGTVLATKMPATAGQEGFNVLGDTLPAKHGDTFELTAGDGTEISQNDPMQLVATTSGCPSEINNGMRVDDVFVIEEVSVKSGHIEFDGSVVVSKNVEPGMKIISKGDVTVLGSVESAEIHADGYIEIKQAAIGHLDHKTTEHSLTCKLIAKGDIEVAYGQYAYLEGHNITFNKQSNHCDLKAFDKITIGIGDKPNGKLIGGEILDAQQVIAGEIGTPSGAKMNIFLAQNGIAITKQTDECVKNLAQVDEQITTLQQAVEKAQQLRDQEKKKVLMQKISATQKHYRQQAKDIEKQLSDLDHHLHDIVDSAQLIANKTLNSGVEIRIFDRVYKTQRTYPRCVAKLEDNQLKIDFN
ncbi:DUF342 domain-containing protein [Pseudoalteromonas phenolica]|uniref:DUF342 domain-containing protein n=1 Tax=Pseudoalteromonas phenolica TaxID=161398 RepID=A0A5S3YS61_9GAMM|nr:FapA family protein [Pseudoalteromonas phenolica]TMP80023.1 DUF342 domain-containing protein [Pseudoalteromonas phenolica]